MYPRTNKHALLLLLTLGLSASTFAVVTSGEGGAVPNIDTSISGRTLTSATITTPKVSATETLRFDVIVSDGVVNVSTPFSITVQNKASSGGSFGWLAFGLMALLGLRGRRLFSRAT